MSVTYIINADAMREVVEAEGSLTEDQITAAVADILGEADQICLYSLAAHVFEATGIDLAEYETPDVSECYCGDEVICHHCAILAVEDRHARDGITATIDVFEWQNVT